MGNSKNEEQLKADAQLILDRFFWLQRATLGNEPYGQVSEDEGWSVSDHMGLVRVIGIGCNNMVRSAEEWSAEDFVAACEWLYDRASHIQYPACWDGDVIARDAWKEFWDAVARPLGKPPRYGLPVRRWKTAEEAQQYRRHRAISRGAVRPLPRAMRLFGIRGEWLLVSTEEEE